MAKSAKKSKAKAKKPAAKKKAAKPAKKAPVKAAKKVAKKAPKPAKRKAAPTTRNVPVSSSTVDSLHLQIGKLILSV